MTAVLIPGGMLLLVALYGWTVVLAAGWGRRKTVVAWVWSDLWRRKASADVGDGPGVYVYMAFGLIPWYSGQAENLARRLDQHGFDIRFMPCLSVATIACPADLLDDEERNLIRAFPWCRLLKINRTKGNQ